MQSSDGASDQGERIPRLAPGWMPEDVALTPAEGFLLSRIDGRTPWVALRQIGGISPEAVDDYLERWVEAGALEFIEPKLDSPEGAIPLDPEAEIDPGLDISEEFQRRILEYEAALETSSYHQILGVAHGADTRAIKLAYFALSKEFHPDRHFRKNIGAYAQRLESIFKKMVEAYELLSDPSTRAELERSMDAAPPDDAGAYRQSEAGRTESIGPERAARGGGYRTPTRMENLARLRSRFKIPKKLLAERRFKARQLFQAAQVAAHQDRWIDAAASVRLAIAFDPWNKEYKEGFGRIQSNVHRERSVDLLDKAEQEGSQTEAMRMVEEAVDYRPMDAETNGRAARLALELGDLQHAADYATTLCEVEPDVVENHVILCRALRRMGRKREARRALDRAIGLDAKDPHVKAERLKLGR
jgi:curved DNA-binding protein CbpA